MLCFKPSISYPLSGTLCTTIVWVQWGGSNQLCCRFREKIIQQYQLVLCFNDPFDIRYPKLSSHALLYAAVCPTNYEAGPTGNCYRFRILDLGSWWSTGRRTCDNEADSDLVIIDNQVELDFLMSRTSVINPNMTWWIGKDIKVY